MKNKTIAAWLSFIGGPMGLHRFYLFGWQDWLGWLLPLPTILGLYGVQRVRTYGIDDTVSWVLLPVLGFVIAGCALTAIVYGLMSTEQWNAKFNPSSNPDASAGQTSWLTIGAVVFSLQSVAIRAADAWQPARSAYRRSVSLFETPLAAFNLHLSARPFVSGRLLCSMLNPQDFDSARLGQNTVEHDVVWMRDQLAHALRQARTARAPQLGVLRERLGLVTQLLAEGLGPGRIVATNVLDDSP